MAERFEMSFRNPELKMWFIIMVPAFIIGAVALFLNDGQVPFLNLIVILGGLLTYYIWRFRYRKKKRKNG
ncbi:hypothetical protein [Planococcus sp. CAU13]|uniref:hypothetical protein n=1 Tax=Planococcus sp. CAU13 TaxID=1541197 RepID=UPI00126A455F|nr:hypothetical protein [Planococcus sp. CAU13]